MGNATDVLTPENLTLSSPEEMETESVQQEDVPKYCLNCGSEVNDKFCPHCRQSASVPQRLSNKSFGKSILTSFGRWNSGFLNTLVKLMTRPWDVVKDYIHGNRFLTPIP